MQPRGVARACRRSPIPEASKHTQPLSQPLSQPCPDEEATKASIKAPTKVLRFFRHMGDRFASSDTSSKLGHFGLSARRSAGLRALKGSSWDRPCPGAGGGLGLRGLANKCIQNHNNCLALIGSAFTLVLSVPSLACQLPGTIRLTAPTIAVTINLKTTTETPGPSQPPAANALPWLGSDRERFVRACLCQPVDRAPVWLMRQAGRVLPEYRALKEKYSFGELVLTPELAAEVTLQPIRRFGFDAAILFSDILVVPEAMGQGYRFREKGGIEMDFGIASPADVARLDEEDALSRLQYVAEALRLIKRELAGKTALIGFAGSPWTLANFMMEGGSVKEYAKARNLFYTNRGLFDQLCEKLTKVVSEFLRMQIDAGVDAIQIFDSLGGLLGSNAFEEASGCWMRRIVASLGGRVPVIVFTKGAHGSLDQLARNRRPGVGYGLDRAPGQRPASAAREHWDSGQPGPAAPGDHAGGDSRGDASHPGRDEGARRAYFQPGTWRASVGET